MREITTHKVNGVNDGLTIRVTDEPGSGGANHHYQIEFPASPEEDYEVVEIDFQNGPIKEAGVNGLTHEALLAILIDRLEGFQRGKFACAANATALANLRNAQTVLLNRTRERVARGVEGTHQV